MLDLVQKLLEQDDSAQLIDAKGYTCLHEAARMGDLDIAISAWRIMPILGPAPMTTVSWRATSPHATDTLS